jgi:carbon-monoxide dehydrogenase medium subunit
VLTLEAGAVREAKIVLGAATETPTRLAAAEDVLRGAAIDDALLRRAGDAAADAVQLMSDPQGSAAYKRQLVRVYVARAIKRALEQ